MAGLLSSAASSIGGLFGTPEGRGQMMEFLASGVDPDRWRKKLLVEEEKRRQEEDKLRREMIEEARKQQQEAQEREAYTRQTVESMAQLNPAFLQQYQSDPAFQSAFRAQLFAHGDPQLAEQSGVLQPQAQQYAPPDVVKSLQAAGIDPGSEQGKQIILQSLQGAQRQVDPYYTALPTAEGYARFNARTGEAEPLVVGGAQTVRSADDPALQRNLAEAKAGGKVAGTATATAMLDLPRIEQAAGDMTRLLGELRTHPGMKRAVGASSSIPIAPWETEATSFVERLNQIKGKNFLEAYQTLKGGGQITEIEGKKAEAAIARMGTAQSEGEFITAVTELEGIINRSAENARRRAAGAAAGGGPAAQTGIVPNSSPAQRGIRRYNPATGRLE